MPRVTAPSRAPYRAPTLTVHGSAAELTKRNWFAPGRVDGGFWWRRTG
ncbi:MAG: lasso RiPP family leader peptide-containing protein [Gemmatimonadaceae bacterium]|nr:lasso RiPP family leader peptide-containing protein [Gemmatimonadaceae bacterium]